MAARCAPQWTPPPATRDAIAAKANAANALAITAAVRARGCTGRLRRLGVTAATQSRNDTIARAMAAAYDAVGNPSKTTVWAGADQSANERASVPTVGGAAHGVPVWRSWNSRIGIHGKNNATPTPTEPSAIAAVRRSRPRPAAATTTSAAPATTNRFQ